MTVRCIAKTETMLKTVVSFSDKIPNAETIVVELILSHSEAANYLVGKLYDLTLKETPPRTE